MNKNNLKKVAACFWLLMLTIWLSGCGGKNPSSDNKDSQPTSVSEETNGTSGKDNINDNQSNTDDITIDEKEWPAASVTFSTTHGYTKLLKLHLELPDGVTASDLTELAFTLDTEAPIELRLYAGAEDVQKSNTHELTGETALAEAVLEGTEQVEVDGNSVEQENYSLNLNKKDGSRFYLSEGKGQNVVFSVDERAAGVLSAIDGDKVVIGIYANNNAPEFTIYNVLFTAKGTEYSVTLDENSVKPSQGSYLQFH